LSIAFADCAFNLVQVLAGTGGSAAGLPGDGIQSGVHRLHDARAVFGNGGEATGRREKGKKESLHDVLIGVCARMSVMRSSNAKCEKLAAIDFLKAIVQASAVLAGAVFGLRYWSLPLGLLAGQLAAVALTRRFVAVTVRRPVLSDLRPLLGYARHLVVGVLAWYAYTTADFAVVGRVAGLSALGLYQFAWNVAQLPGEKLGNVLQSVVGPFFGSIGDDAAKLRHYFLVFSEFLAAIMLPALCGFALVSPVAVPLIFGTKWASAVPIMQILVVSAAIGSISLLAHHVLGATGQAEFGKKLNLVALVVLPLSFYVAARVSGPVAVASVWLLAQPVLVLVPLSRMRATIQLSIVEFLQQLRAPVFSSAGMTVVVFLVKHALVGVSPVGQVVAMVCAGAVVYPLLYRLLFADRARGIVSVWRTR